MKNFWAKCKNYPMSEVWTKFKKHKRFAEELRAPRKCRLPKWQIKKIKEEKFFAAIGASRKPFDPTPTVTAPKPDFNKMFRDTI